MSELSETEMTALRLMLTQPIHIDALSDVPNREHIASVLDGLAQKGLCRRTLKGLRRVYSITADGEKVIRAS